MSTSQPEIPLPSSTSSALKKMPFTISDSYSMLERARLHGGVSSPWYGHSTEVTIDNPIFLDLEQQLVRCDGILWLAQPWHWVLAIVAKGSTAAKSSDKSGKALQPTLSPQNHSLRDAIHRLLVSYAFLPVAR